MNIQISTWIPISMMVAGIGLALGGNWFIIYKVKDKNIKNMITFIVVLLSVLLIFFGTIWGSLSIFIKTGLVK
ncbi:MAG: hypothetical protein PHE59_04405 [Patescibacteria group bacterium]|nr:hypothetical protein [Patescibacteria group bacterium]MDD5164674.1 hypothetical protein [Patescibacteria group bacterium]MDD5535004.1 hypothetical protein [Patescibacteria group bacterium]